MQSYAERACEDCGKLVRKRNRRDRPHLCIGCAGLRTERAVMDQINRSGPAYEAWKAGEIKRLEKLIREHGASH